MGQFLDKAITEDLIVRLQFSEYMSIVSASPEQRKRWLAYHNLVKSQFSEKRDELRNLQSTVAKMKEIEPLEIPTVTGESESIDFAALFDARKTDELALSRLGERAFDAGEFGWAIKSLEQADKVKASGVWQSSYPYLIASLYKLDKPEEAEKATQEMLQRINTSINKGYGYLANDTPQGFLLQNLGDAKTILSDTDKKQVDALIDQVIALKQKAH